MQLVDIPDAVTEPTALELLAKQADLLEHIYAAQLWCIGVVGAFVVLFLLYKFLRKVY